MIYFILGSQPELSIAELKAVLKADYRPVFETDDVVVIEPADLNLSVLQERLGGIIKMGRVVAEMTSWNPGEAADLFASLASSAAGKNKISFGLSVYDVGNSHLARALTKDLDRLGLEIKKRLKLTERPVRYVKGKEPQLSSAIIQTNGLLESGGEFLLIVTPSGVLLGQSEGVQDFKAWSDRDFGRPARDARNGMLPPKLARMMINLGGIDPKGASLLDPFCGSGTVLMEATLMGCDLVIGSDISEKAVHDTDINMQWLAEWFDAYPPQFALHVSPADQLPSLHSTPVDLIVTEVFLGNPRTQSIDHHEGQRLERELLPMFESSFEALKMLLNPNGRMVVAFPAFKSKDGDWHRLPLQALLQRLDYTIVENHLYFRSNQFVARDIYVLTLK